MPDAMKRQQYVIRRSFVPGVPGRFLTDPYGLAGGEWGDIQEAKLFPSFEEARKKLEQEHEWEEEVCEVTVDISLVED